MLLLAPPLLAFGLVYLASLVALFISSFWTVNPFTTEIEHIWNLDNYRTIWDSSAYRSIALRTIGIAAAVTLTDAVLAFPLGYFMARIASGRSRTFLFVAVLLPLWSSYLIRVYIWRLILNEDGVLNWTLGGLGLPRSAPRVHELGRVDRLLVRLAAVHDPAGLRRARAASRTRSSRRRAISARAASRRSAASCSRSRCRA